MTRLLMIVLIAAAMCVVSTGVGAADDGDGLVAGWHFGRGVVSVAL